MVGVCQQETNETSSCESIDLVVTSPPYDNLRKCNEGDVVLDPFVGSGTTILAALDLNRKYIGIDISKEYVDLTKKRIREHGKPNN